MAIQDFDPFLFHTEITDSSESEWDQSEEHSITYRIYLLIL